MKLTITLFVSSIAVVKVASGAPVSYSPYNNNVIRYFNFPCAQQGYLCNRGVQTRHTPVMFSGPVTHSPVLKQVFATITRKHDNLNTAQASNKKGIRVKYQDGPSVEAEGEHTASVYSKQRGGEHSYNPIFSQEQFDQFLPNNQFERMQPEQDDLSMQPANGQEQFDQEMPNSEPNIMQSAQTGSTVEPDEETGVEPDEETEVEPEDE
ncbi:hypothetical protein K7432_016181 [Basidiobolus ranarum]|uniref:Uncharacterized protein n=1 Tax=Basidiobolus ranarum TaxID=34480 RepID=A0ABR2WF33_9FUNG